MTLSIDCENQKCEAIFHTKIKKIKKHKIVAICPFCKTKHKRKVGE